MNSREGGEGKGSPQASLIYTDEQIQVPQKHVAVASFSLDQPSSAQPAKGM